ncbi:MAG: hypothetical protein OQK09_12095 [Colwellia sp.]|nr:hypothetical protein [Colwellia sp.]MCW8864520.1 hypothetical protein [Colwellia sp.]MCW9082244.1 hypothetical protein [Colwellia sp.]
MEVKVRWEVSPKMFDIVKEEFNANDIKYRKGLGFDPISGVVVALSVTLLIKIALKALKDTKYCGVIIDTTKTPIEVKEMPNWDRNQMLLISDKGAEIKSFTNKDDDVKSLMKLIK